MTRLRGMTLSQFNGLVEDMRKAYPFKDEETKIIDTHDLSEDCNCLLELYAHDKDTGVDVRLSKGVNYDEW